MKKNIQILQDLLEIRENEGLLRGLSQLEEGIDFYSNDYLGLAGSQEIEKKITSFSNTLKRKLNICTSLGSTGSRLISGNHPIFELFESECAKFHKAEAALFFGSGFEANVGLLAAIGLENHVIICDKLIHASLVDGLRLSKAEKRIFKHNDLADLEKILTQYPLETPKWVIVESIYSMDGDEANLVILQDLSKKYNFELIVDEAHSGGIYGPNGEGKCVELELEKEIFARIITFGKAWGYSGAVVLGSKTLKNYLINFARPFIFSTAPTIQHLIDLWGILSIQSTFSLKRKELYKVINFFNEQKKSTNWLKSNTAIQSFIIPGNENVRKKAELLQTKGFKVKPIVYPTVPKGQERIRITLHAFQKQEDIKKIINLLEENE